VSLNIDSSQWRLSTAGGIPYKLMDGYPTGSFDEENGQVTEKIIIEADNLNAFILESFSDSTLVPGLVWLFAPGRRYPGGVNLITRKLSFEPFPQGRPGDPWASDPNPPDGTYCDYVVLTVEYGTGKGQGDQEDDNSIEVSCSAGGEFLVLPPEGVLNDGVQNQNPTFPVTKTVPSLEWNARYSRVPRTNLSAVLTLARSLLGKVNSTAMPIFYCTAEETMLFVGLSLNFKWMWRSAQPYAQVDLKFQQKIVVVDGTHYGHNHFWHPGPPAKWVRVTQAGGTEDVYQKANLNQLFY